MEPLSGLDARFLYSETAHAPMHTMKIAVIDAAASASPFDPEAFVATLDERVRTLPPLLRRPVPMAFGMGHPVWVDDPDFAVRNHIAIRAVDPPGGDRELARIVAEVASTPLPRDRPLWAVTLVADLADGRMAAIGKIHHSVADGAATVEMLSRVLNDHGPANPVNPAEPGATTAAPALPDRRGLRRVATRARRAKVRMLPGLAAASTRNTAMTAWRRWRSPIRTAKPFDGPRTSLNVSLPSERTFAMTTLALPDLLAVRQALGGTLNDAYLAVCTGALRHYFLARDEPVDRALVASVPIGVRGDNAPRTSGNRVDNMYVRLPVQLADPAARFRAIHADAAAARELRDVMDPVIVARRVELTPTHLYPVALRLFAASKMADRMRPPVNLIVSNVAGPRDRLHLGSTVLDSIFSVGPLLEGVGLNLTAWSYAGGMHVGALGSPDSLADPWALVDRLPEALDELVTTTSSASSNGDGTARSGRTHTGHDAGSP
ncbi:MAG TPA: wax ester/triacylglycerol synthase family O-acyltransferase [Acidimicrobiia bacterium]|nr:wax ester/triacylglycerol synthase family O-acyltransferase [Acidimicrobiia bacterium]